MQAMMTGTVPNFVDIVLNFGSKPLSSDSLLLQAKKQGHKLVFYGDDTWLSLFPNVFERHDGTVSFFVTDFTEVKFRYIQCVDKLPLYALYNSTYHHCISNLTRASAELLIFVNKVDNNVTRHIRDELNNDDWSVMILHYLGLDHIGHVEGPSGASIRPKLREMDEIVARIAHEVRYWVSV